MARGRRSRRAWLYWKRARLLHQALARSPATRPAAKATGRGPAWVRRATPSRRPSLRLTRGGRVLLESVDGLGALLERHGSRDEAVAEAGLGEARLEPLDGGDVLGEDEGLGGGVGPPHRAQLQVSGWSAGCEDMVGVALWEVRVGVKQARQRVAGPPGEGGKAVGHFGCCLLLSPPAQPPPQPRTSFSSACSLLSDTYTGSACGTAGSGPASLPPPSPTGALPLSPAAAAAAAAAASSSSASAAVIPWRRSAAVMSRRQRGHLALAASTPRMHSLQMSGSRPERHHKPSQQAPPAGPQLPLLHPKDEVLGYVPCTHPPTLAKPPNRHDHPPTQAHTCRTNGCRASPMGSPACLCRWRTCRKRGGAAAHRGSTGGSSAQLGGGGWQRRGWAAHAVGWQHPRGGHVRCRPTVHQSSASQTAFAPQVRSSGSGSRPAGYPHSLLLRRHQRVVCGDHAARAGAAGQAPPPYPRILPKQRVLDGQISLLEGAACGARQGAGRKGGQGGRIRAQPLGTQSQQS